eukprot:1359929-Alexandrium_andersonii.AAC.1
MLCVCVSHRRPPTSIDECCATRSSRRHSLWVRSATDCSRASFARGRPSGTLTPRKLEPGRDETHGTAFREH